MIELLGWDIKNNQAKKTNEREVLVEEVQKTTRKPDYTFRLYSERKFFLEAKRPSIDISTDSKSAHQVRTYGFTDKLKISVLSNFEHLALYDCSSPVDESEGATHSRIKIYHYSEYVEKFDEIRRELSQESVYSGDFDNKWSHIADKIKTSNIDHLFLAQINTWRDKLAVSFVSIKSDIDTVELNDLTQRYINSIVFLRVCEDRDIEEYEALLKLSNAENYKLLIKKFNQADKKYNSGLFNLPHIEKFFSDKNSYIWEILKDLYFPKSIYSFSVFSSAILGNIYEIFLSETVSIDAGGKPKRHRKPDCVDKDIVTTPIHIVRDILRKTLTPRLDKKDADQILSTRVADISCGSGAFLLEAYQLMHDTLVDYYIEHDKKQLDRIGINSFKLTFDRKKQLLTNCIFGVDKDYGATQACKFGLLLKLLEGEKAETIGPSVPALPILDNNIQCGNSLIDSSMSTSIIVHEINPYQFGSDKFDVIIGNPPYLKTEDMINLMLTEFNLYKENYTSAYQQFDKYFLFVERALQLLSDDGLMGYILPLKFMKVAAGKRLRELLSVNKYVSDITSFGATQVFPSKTTYTCILTLSKKQSNDFCYTEVTSLDNWKKRINTPQEIKIPSTYISSNAWLLNASLFKSKNLDLIYKKITSSNPTLETIIGSENISNGIQTSADKIYIHEPTRRDKDYIYFKKDGKDWKIEKELTRPYFKKPTKRGGDDGLHTHRAFTPNSFVIYPYEKIGGKVKLVNLKELKKRCPFLHKYLTTYKDKLSKRAMPKALPDEWHQYGRNQNLDKGSALEKIIVGVQSSGNKYAVDTSGALSTSGGTAGYAMITIPDNFEYSSYYLQALLNSKYVEWIASLYGEVFRGGYISRGTKVFPRFPIIEIDFKDEKSRETHDLVSKAQIEIIKTFTKMDQCKTNSRLFEPLERSYKQQVKKMDKLLKELYGLDDTEDGLIPTISEIYGHVK
jgi:type I restriction-modification system DNA methylase subunit